MAIRQHRKDHDDHDDLADPDEERPVEDEKDEVDELSSVSARSFDSDSQASSSFKDSHCRSASFDPLHPSHLAEENVEMETSSPLTLGELSDGEDRRRLSSCRSSSC
ncbi:hypothetical protein PF008_g12733 [Phytophthora fragariae]|uniref:Uncharacterized protein n=1 Tax=Phytophthora fragariae TaxID=53985 RepID=A0A6G0RMW5_9STRA|nr:hypothetical protein PF008_g12733 [Phytophthora fragariae]